MLPRLRLYSGGWSERRFGGGAEGVSCNLVDEFDDEAVPVHFEVDLIVEGEASEVLGIATDLKEVATLKLVIFGVGCEEAADEAFERSEVKDL